MGTKITIPSIKHTPLQEEVMQACKLQRHYSQHCEITTKVFDGGTGAVVLHSTQAAELTWDQLKKNMGLTKHFN